LLLCFFQFKVPPATSAIITNGMSYSHQISIVGFHIVLTSYKTHYFKDATLLTTLYGMTL